MQNYKNKEQLTPKWEQLKILVIDDNKASAATLKSQLTNMGVKNTDVTFSYDAALKKCTTKSYHILLIDYHLKQTVNGCEIASLLRKKKLISPSCGVIIISDDTSSEVVLTAISQGHENIISKPTNITTLKRSICQVYATGLQAVSIQQALRDNVPPKEINLRLQRSECVQNIDVLMLEALIKHNRWILARELLDKINHKQKNFKLTLYKAQIGHHFADTEQAIHLLESLIAKAPLCIEAYDLLAKCQASQQLYWDALVTAERALKLTPSVNHRALNLAEIASNISRKDKLIHAGQILATNLSIIDVSWIVDFAKFTAYFEKIYLEYSSSDIQRQLLTDLKEIQQKANNRLMHSQRPFLTIYNAISCSRLTLAKGMKLKAKSWLFHGLSTHYNEIEKLPTVILVETLPLLMVFGETRLISEIQKALKVRDHYDDHSQLLIKQLNENQEQVSAVKELDVKLTKAFQDIQRDTGRSLDLYEEILINYPYSSEANLGLLQCMLLLNNLSHHKIADSINAVEPMPLPEKLEAWRNNIVKGFEAAKDMPNSKQSLLDYRHPDQSH